MTDSAAEQPVRKGLVPFQKGFDPRRHKYGKASKDRVEWAAKFNNLLALKLPPDEAVETLIREYKRGKSWAILEVLRRLVGEPIQSLEITSAPDQKLTIEIVRPDEKK